ncbi:SDR family oxidoreductase [Oleomonas cavernae]|uniref:SDR family oxidoreductase n=1 Tax=Oleomonas cavernae TaxID=2320859 RepID=A0A418WTS4_9PROT|nr:SDR family oxidoreductase [Oleomonas cavernae]RJF94597.1 SDR family oxidoreductase [Oleomonas cavernae]
MNYFLTGATGFIGKFLLERLLARPKAQIYVLVRPSSREKYDALLERFGDAAEGRLHMVEGDVTQDGLVAIADLKKLEGKIDHIFHLAAVYDMNMDDATGDKINNEGTRNVVDFANSLGGKVTLHHVSSIAVAGDGFAGVFSEDMFDEGQDVSHPYYRTKFQSEKIVREASKVPFRIYRPGAVVGDSRTGEMDKVDGPYYFFKTIQKLSHAIPKWLPLLGIEGGRVALVPVDYVAAAMDVIAHKPGLDGKAFFLIQSPSPTVGQLLQTIMSAAHGPEFAKRFELPLVSRVAGEFTKRMGKLVPDAVKRQVSKTLGLPVSVLGQAFNRTIFDDKQARAALEGSGVRCPDLHDYADKLWQYWEQHLDFETDVPPRLLRKLQGKVVVVTGASSGIGLVTAKKLAAAGAKVVLVARGLEKLESAQKIIQKAGGEAYVYSCDLSDLNAIDAMAEAILRDFGHVDVLINNAGRSIRRAVFESLDRFHDYERTMQLNYFGPVRLIMKLLPSMAERKSGHIINISSIGVLANAPRFSAYVASKAALDAFSRCLSAEVKARDIEITAIYMPLVRTPMIAPTKLYDYVPTWSPERAGNTVIKAIVERPKSIATGVGTAAALSYAVWPKLNDYILSQGFRLFPSSSAAKSVKEGGKPSVEQVIFSNVFKGEHW